MRLILLFLFLSLVSCRPDSKIKLTAGASSAVVNPPVGSYIAGADRNRTFTGVKDSLFVKAVVVNDGKSSVAIVTIDCIGLLYPEIQKIQLLAAEGSSLPADRIVVSSTHTHAGPDVVGIWGHDIMSSGRDSTYLSFLVRSAAEQVIKADQNRRPAELFGTEGSYLADWYANICQEEIDRSVSVLHLRSVEGNSIATLTNFACHPTFLDTHFSVVSSDYPGAFYKSMDSSYGGVNLFLQGAIGGWVQPGDHLFVEESKVEGEPLAFQLAERYGRNLADSVTRLLNNAGKLSNAEIRFNKLDFSFPVENQNWRILSQAGVIKRVFTDSVKTTLSWFSIGNAQFITHPGETTPWLGLQSKSLMQTGPRFVLGLSQDALGYILKPEFFSDTTRHHSGYLTSMSLGPKTTPILLEKIKAVMGRTNAR